MKTSAPSQENPRFRVFFGGPDCRPRALRDLLDAHISAVPYGGEIFWATYYFRDESLADALVQAKRRGVEVRLALEAKPRAVQTNLSVLTMLQSPENLGSDCSAVRHPRTDNLHRNKPRLHIKLYYFSHPEPHVLVGTFNPSGNIPEEPDIIAEVGDQDRGHNHLVEIIDNRIVLPLREHLLFLHAGPHGPWERFLLRNNGVLAAGDSRIYIFPRLRRNVIRRKLLALPKGTTLRMAVSHINDRGIVETLVHLSRRGVHIEILTHDTERRVPGWTENMLKGELLFRRYSHPQGFPMHNKFILIDSPRGREVIFGSMNLSERSLYANHELLVASANSFLYDTFLDRWDLMIKETEEML